MSWRSSSSSTASGPGKRGSRTQTARRARRPRPASSPGATAPRRPLAPGAGPNPAPRAPRSQDPAVQALVWADLSSKMGSHRTAGMLRAVCHAVAGTGLSRDPHDPRRTVADDARLLFSTLAQRLGKGAVTAEPPADRGAPRERPRPPQPARPPRPPRRPPPAPPPRRGPADPAAAVPEAQGRDEVKEEDGDQGLEAILMATEEMEASGERGSGGAGAAPARPPHPPAAPPAASRRASSAVQEDLLDVAGLVARRGVSVRSARPQRGHAGMSTRKGGSRGDWGQRSGILKALEAKWHEVATGKQQDPFARPDNLPARGPGSSGPPASPPGLVPAFGSGRPEGRLASGDGFSPGLMMLAEAVNVRAMGAAPSQASRRASVGTAAAAAPAPGADIGDLLAAATELDKSDRGGKRRRVGGGSKGGLPPKPPRAPGAAAAAARDGPGAPGVARKAPPLPKPHRRKSRPERLPPGSGPGGGDYASHRVFGTITIHGIVPREESRVGGGRRGRRSGGAPPSGSTRRSTGRGSCAPRWPTTCGTWAWAPARAWPGTTGPSSAPAWAARAG